MRNHDPAWVRWTLKSVTASPLISCFCWSIHPICALLKVGWLHLLRSEEDGFCETVYKNYKRDPDWQEHMVTHGRVCLQKIYNHWLHMCKTYKICKIIGYYTPGDLHDYHPLPSCAPLCHLSCLCLSLSAEQMQAVKVRGEMLTRPQDYCLMCTFKHKEATAIWPQWGYGWTDEEMGVCTTHKNINQYASMHDSQDKHKFNITDEISLNMMHPVVKGNLIEPGGKLCPGILTIEWNCYTGSMVSNKQRVSGQHTWSSCGPDFSKLRRWTLSTFN